MERLLEAEVPATVSAEELERQMRRAHDGAVRARPEEYSHLDDVPLSIKRARTLAIVSDPVVVK